MGNLHEDGENSGFKGADLMLQSQIWKTGCHVRKEIRATRRQGFFLKSCLILLKVLTAGMCPPYTPFPWHLGIRAWHGVTVPGGVLHVSTALQEPGLSGVQQPQAACRLPMALSSQRMAQIFMALIPFCAMLKTL